MKAELKAKISTIFLGTALAVLLVPGVAMADAVDLETSVVSDIPSTAALPTDLQNDEAQDDTDADPVSTALGALATVEESMQDDMLDSTDVEGSTDASEAPEDETPLTAQDTVESGEFDNGLTWEVSDIGGGEYELRISGVGTMPSFAYGATTPWSSYASNIVQLTLEDGVNNIGAAAFKDLVSLRTIYQWNVSAIGSEAFSGCSNLNMNLSFPDQLAEIGDSAFMNCGLSVVNIPTNTFYIGAQAFYGCPLTEVTIGTGSSTLQQLGQNAFGSTIACSVTYAGTRAQWENIVSSYGSDSDYMTSSYIHFTQTTYVITFDANNGYFGDGSSTTTLDTNGNGQLTSLPSEPTRAGFTFDGWYDDPTYGSPVTAWGTPFNSDARVYAHWTELAGSVSYVISFDPNGGTVDGGYAITTIQTNEYGVIVTLPTAYRDGHEFLGWFDAQGNQIFGGHVFTADTDVFAHWGDAQNPTIYSISFDSNGGTSVYPSSIQTDQYGYLTEFPFSDPTREGYKFAYWALDTFGFTRVWLNETKFDADTTIYAFWTALPIYTITIDVNGGESSDGLSEMITNDNGELTELPAAPTREGWNFAGWFDAREGGNPIVVPHTFEGHSVIYAHWSSTPVYTVFFNMNDGTDTVMTSLVTNENGQLESLPVPTRDGYMFVGWFTAAEGGEQIVVNTTTFTANTEAYAQWTIKPADAVTYTITFNRNDGSSDAASIMETDYDGKLSSLPSAPALEGHEFIGWFTAAEGGEQVVANSTVFSANANVYAQWKKLENTIIYEIVEGANSTWNPEDSEDLEIRCDGSFEDFDHIMVDGEIVPEIYYDVRSGSTIVSLKPSFLASLAEGDHDITFVYKNGGEAKTSFKIPVKPAVVEPGNNGDENKGDNPGNNPGDNNDGPIFIPDDSNIVLVSDQLENDASYTDNPKTGDSGNALALFLLMLIAAVCFGGLKTAQRNRA